MPSTHPHPRRHQTKRKTIPLRFQVILLIERLFRQQAFSGHLLHSFLEKQSLSSQDRALFTELYYGLLRRGHELLYRVDSLLANPQKTPRRVRWILAQALYQKKYLSRIPDHAMVHEAVQIAREHGASESMVATVNAVLRKYLRQQSDSAQDPLWMRFSLPEWLMSRLMHQWGSDMAQVVATSLLARSPVTVRVNPIKSIEKNIIQELTGQGVQVLATPLPGCLILENLTGSPAELIGYQRGDYSLQNRTSQQIAPWLDPRAGQDILDACAGQGGKTHHLAELTKNEARIFCDDIDESKLRLNLARAGVMGLCSVQRAQKGQTYDRILLDAPCSGLGTIASHPEIKWYRQERDLSRYALRQLALLREKSSLLRVGGKLLYAVCSMDKVEGEFVIRDFLKSSPHFKRDPEFSTPYNDGIWGTTIFPTDSGGSGYFVSRLVRQV